MLSVLIACQSSSHHDSFGIQVFTTGTMGELTPVVEIDGRVIGTGLRGPITQRLQEEYKLLPDRDGWATPLPEFA
jgi:protein-lysine N-methyltransferase EEF2KMT